MSGALPAAARAMMKRLQTIQIPHDAEITRSYGDFNELLGVLDKLHIDLFGETYEESRLEDRGDVTHRVTLAIAVRKRFSQDDHNNSDAGKPRINVEEIDALIDLTQRLHDFWLEDANRLLPDDVYSIAWASTNLVQNPSRKMLMEHHQFFGLIRLTYDASKPL